MVTEYVIITILIISIIIIFTTSGRCANRIARYKIERVEADAKYRVEQARSDYETKLQDAVAANHKRLEDTLTRQAAEHRAELESVAAKADKDRTKSLTTQRSVINGQAFEQLAPYLPGFEYNPSDCRFMESPIDFLMFDGLKDEKADVNMIIIDVKTGSAQINANQRRIKKAVEVGRVRFEVIRQSENSEEIVVKEEDDTTSKDNSSTISI